LSTELVTFTGNTIAPYQSTGWEDDDNETPRARTKYLKIRQAKSENAEGIPLGNFFYKDATESFRSMTIVPLGIKFGREKQTPYKPGSVTETLCASNDRKVPWTSNPLSTDCPSCFYGDQAWAAYDKKTRANKPVSSCEKYAEMLFVHVAPKGYEGAFIEELFILKLKGGLNRPVLEELRAKLNSARDNLRAQEAAKKGVPSESIERPPMHRFRLKISTVPSGEFFKVTYDTEVEVLSENQAAPYGQHFADFLATLSAAAAYSAGANNDREVNEALETQAEVIQESPAPYVAPTYKPPVSRRVAGTKPVYQPPVIDAEVDEDEPEVTI
jgi:hypothetical protein